MVGYCLWPLSIFNVLSGYPVWQELICKLTNIITVKGLSVKFPHRAIRSVPSLLMTNREWSLHDEAGGDEKGSPSPEYGCESNRSLMN